MRESRSRFQVTYEMTPGPLLLDRPDTLAAFSFEAGPSDPGHPHHLRLALPPLSGQAPTERWSVAGQQVRSGSTGALRWSTAGGWRFVAVELDEAAHGGIEATSEKAYQLLLDHVVGSPEPYLHRIWNYLAMINAGTGDLERYRRFCTGRARSLAARAVTHYPAATAIGHHGSKGLLQVYALCGDHPGDALENPRQVSAWDYPRRYGPTSPSFARAMQLPNGSLAISGTAAVIGHASHHAGDVTAQTNEAFANLASLLKRAGLPAFDAHSPLKVYVRDPRDARTVDSVLARHLDPDVPRLMLQGDICRRELLVEIDGWRFAP